MITKQQNTPHFVDQLQLYQSANNDAKSIKEHFVIRINEFNTIINALKNKDKKDPLQHELILGGRGSGKSTLLRRIEIEIKEDKKLSKKYIAINLAEEQASIYRLSDLWYETLIEIEPNIELTAFSDFKNNDEYTSYLLDVLNQELKKLNKKAVLLLDNFDKIIDSIGKDTASLRATLINKNNIQIIAASTKISEHFWKYDQPFFDFFRQHKLKALSLEEINTLFNHWSNIPQYEFLKDYAKHHRGNIEAVRILTDGLPRTLQFFIKILLTDNENFDSKYIKKIMDKATPLYQERLWSLTKPQQKIVLETAFIWKPVSTKELVNVCRMESKLISSYLKQLISYGIVEKLKTNTKNNKYRIAERFFNMWLIVTQGNPNQRRKAIYLTLFLEYWYNKDEIKNLATSHLSKLKTGKLSFDKASIQTKALSQSKHITLKMRDELIENTLLLNESPASYGLPRKSTEIIDQVIELLEKGKLDLALKKVEQIENENDGIKFYMLGVIYTDKKEFKKAEKYYLMAIEKENNDAMNNLANLYVDQKELKNAEKYYLMAIDKKYTSAMFNLALLYGNQQKLNKAEKYFLMAYKKGHTHAIHYLAILCGSLLKFKKAEKYFLIAIKNKNINANYYLSLVYLKQNINPNKSLILVKKNPIKKDPQNLLIKILVEVWNGIFNNLSNDLDNVFKIAEIHDIHTLLIHLLYLNQHNLALNLFKDKEFGKKRQEEHQLLYFATLILTNNIENIHLEIPEEVIPTVQDIVKEVKLKNEFYSS